MASAFAHALVGASIGLLAVAAAAPASPEGASEGSPRPSRFRLVTACAVISTLPDADTLMHLFVPYSHALGHRGAFHSPVFYAAVAWVLSGQSWPRAKPRTVGIAVFLALLSHSLLDMLTNGGLGVALYWPLSDERYFFPVRPLPVSPLSVGAFFSERGLRILKVEMPFALSLLAGSWLIYRFRGALRRNPSEPRAANRHAANQTERQGQTALSTEEGTEFEDADAALPPGDDIAVLEIEEFIDLHSFAPRDILDVVEAYLEAAVERGYQEVRLIHGRGKGVQRARIRKLLESHPDVLSFKDAPHTRGGWGATLVWLKQEDS